MTQIHFTIKGRVISKKNSKRIVCRGRFPMVLPSAAYARFKAQALTQTIGLPKMLPPYKVEYIFDMKGKAATDGDNMEASINDILQEAGVLEDDKEIIEWTGKKNANKSEYITHITITTL